MSEISMSGTVDVGKGCPTLCLQGRRDLNPQPLVLETSALPIELRPSATCNENQDEPRTLVEPVHATSAISDPVLVSRVQSLAASFAAAQVQSGPTPCRDADSTEDYQGGGQPHEAGFSVLRVPAEPQSASIRTGERRSNVGRGESAQCSANRSMLVELGPTVPTRPEVASQREIRHRVAVGGGDQPRLELATLLRPSSPQTHSGSFSRRRGGCPWAALCARFVRTGCFVHIGRQ